MRFLRRVVDGDGAHPGAPRRRSPLAARQLIQPVASSLEALAGDRLAAYVTEQLVLAANRRRGLARFEDPAFADDLERARRRGGQGGLEVLVYGTRGALALFSAIGFALVLLTLHPLVPLLILLATLPQLAGWWEFNTRTQTQLYNQTPEARHLRVPCAPFLPGGAVPPEVGSRRALLHSGQRVPAAEGRGTASGFQLGWESPSGGGSR